MACLMLLSCWVFVAPEHAHAATAGNYTVRVRVQNKNAADGGSAKLIVKYKPTNGTGTETSTEIDITSEMSSNEGNNITKDFTLSGFPTSVQLACIGTQGFTYDSVEGILNGVFIYNGSSYVQVWGVNDSISGSSGNYYTAKGSGGWGSVSWEYSTAAYQGDGLAGSVNWTSPTGTSVSTALSAQTITVPNGGGSASKTFTAIFKDQYGVEWGAGGYSYSLNAMHAAGASTSYNNNDTITVTADQTVFDNLSTYNSSTGKATTTLNILCGNASTSCTVTFQSSLYTVGFNDACGTVHNKTCYYNGSVTAPGACAKDPDNSYHYAFSSWNDTTFSGIKANKSVTANYTGTAHTFEGDWVYNGDGTHSRECTSVDADATCTIVGLNGNAYGTTGGSAACTGTWTGDDTTHSQTCTTCGDTKTHAPVWVETVASKYQKTAQDCENDGEYYKSCSTCGLAHTTETFKPADQTATGHAYTEFRSHVNHTCTEDGYDIYGCENCGIATTKVYDADGDGVTDDPAAHTWATTLTDKGDDTHGYKCTKCDDGWNEVADHVWTLAETITAPTCVDDGSGKYTCPCGATKTDVISADGVSHHYLDAVSNNDGTHSAFCEHCNKEIKEDCVNDGDCVCDVCSYNFAHVYDKEVATDAYKASDATCTAKATYYYSCQCGDKGAAAFESGEALGHDYTEESSEVKSPADCDNAQTNWYGCSRCDANAKDDTAATDKYYEVGSALGHNYAAKDDKSNIVLGGDGNGKHLYYCQNGCGTTGGAVDCNYGDYTYDSTNHYRKCGDCGYIEETAHSLTDWAADKANGETDGTHSRECSVCDYAENNQTCNYETTVTAATCTTGTITTYTCTDCGHGYSVNDGVVDASNHSDYGTWADESTAVASTCTENGKDADEKCLGCNAVRVTGATRPLDYTNHGDNTTSVEGYIEATCTIEGHTGKVVCDGCGNTITEDTNVGINENNHVNKTAHNGLAATCEADGYTEYETCDACGDELGKTVIPATGHDYVDGTPAVLDGDVHAYECKNGCGTTGVGTTKDDTEDCSGGTATCIALAVCDICKDTHGDYAAHVFDGAYNQVTGTETHNRLCSVCENAYGLDGIVDAAEDCSGGEATCLDKAECELCGGEHGEALGHDYSAADDRINQPEDGYHNYKCSRCDEYGIVENDAQVDGGKIACYDAEPVRTAETCTENAYWTHICDTCAYTWTVTEEDTALGHDYTEKLVNDAHKKSDADCENAAVYWYDCSRCDKNANIEEDTDKYTDLTYTNGSALGHKFEGRTEYLYKAADATCTSNETYYVYCTVCKKSSKDTDSEATFVKYDTALEHQYAEIVDENDLTKNRKSEATCTAAAVYYESCSVCGAKGTETFSYGEALGHTFTEKIMNAAHKITDASCTTMATYWYDCAVCNTNAANIDKTDMTEEEIAALKYTDGELAPNKHSNLVDVALKLPTCTEDGHSAYQKCEDCGTEIGKVTEGYEKKDHNFTGAYTYDAETDTHKRACLNNCGTYSEAADCSFGSWKQTVDADGKAAHTRECVCGNTETGDCAGGTATCLKKAECSTCGKTYGDTLEHKYPDTWTSTGKGTHTKACENGCGVDLTEACSGGTATCKDKAVCDTCKAAYGETTSHTFETYEQISEAKCGVNAKEKATCKYCDATDEKEIAGTALKHAMGDYTTDSEYAKVPTCKDEGIEVSYCTREGCDYYVTRTIPAVKDAHVWGEWTVIGGDCATGISEERECSVCGETENRKNYDVEHEYKEVARVKATCLVDGYIEYVCTNCNFTYVYDNTVEGFPGEYSELKAKGEHTWGEVIETKAPTCAHEGRGYQICTVCNAKSDSVAIAKLGHGWEDGDDRDNDYIYHAPIDATCDTDGHSGYYECTQCATGKTEPDAVFKATGHADKNGDGKCDSCNGEIYDDGDKTKSCGCICHKDNWFMQLIYKIVRFFWKLFKIGKSCDCGFVHY